jgi:WD40 repeat protein
MTAPTTFCNECGASNPLQATYCFACNNALQPSAPSPLLPIRTASSNAAVLTSKGNGPLAPFYLLHSSYSIDSQIGTGGFGAVYQAQDTLFSNRLVAIKEMNQESLSPRELAEATAAFEREALVLTDLTHPNLPRIYDYFVENQRWYFVRDFLEGETLEVYLSKRNYRPLPAAEVLDSGIQLSTVLDYLRIHQSPLGFKDLTLSTIWRTPDGKLYLLDTGAALPATAMSESSSISSLGKILRQLQEGKMSVRSRLPVALPKLRKRSRHPQSLPLKVLIRQMVRKDVRKGPYTMTLVKQELQHLATQHISPKKRLLSRRALLKWGGLAGLAAASSWLTEQVELLAHRQVPHPGYSPNLGGTLYTYDASSSVLAVAWSPDGTRIVLGGWGADWGQVQAWDANTGQHVINYRYPSLQQRVEAVAWLPDGKSIVAGGDDAIVCVWDAASGEIQGIYCGHTGMVITVACSPDSKYIASGSNDQSIQVWEVATGRKLVIYSGHSSGIGSVTWSPDGKYIASASFDRTVQIWEAATGRHVFTYYGHTDMVYTVAWSPDGQRIASGGKDLTVQVWPVALSESAGQQQKHPIITYRGHTRAVQAVAWSPDSRTIASAADNVQLWNGLTGEQIFTYTKHAVHVALEVQTVAWSPNGRYIASGGTEGTVQVWNAR